MSNAVIAFLVAISFATWVYTRAQRRLGGSNTKSALSVAALAGIATFIVVLTLMSFIPD